MKVEGREDRDRMKAEGREGTETRSQTIGQAGAAAKLSTEQRTRITTVIRDQHVAPLKQCLTSRSRSAPVFPGR